MIRLQFPILLSSVLVPFVGSILLPLVDKRLGKNAAKISVLLLMYPLAIIAFLLLYYQNDIIIDPIYFSDSRLGSFSMLLDPLSMPLAFSIALVPAFVAIYSIPYMEHRFKELEREGGKSSWGLYCMLFIMFASAMLGTVLSTNTIEFYIFLELTLIPSFLLIAFYGYGDRIRIALMYLIWTHVGALLFLIGAMTLGYNVGTFDYFNPITGEALKGLGERLPEAFRLSVALVLSLGLFVKMAVFGVHIWLPYAHAEAPTPVSALLSPNLIGIAAYALVRIVYVIFPETFSSLALPLLALAVITMVYGGFMVLAQDDFKRLLAYSSISQMGYLLLGVSSVTPFGICGAMLHYMAHAIGKAVLFMIAGILIIVIHTRKISEMGGLAARMPTVFALALLGFMHITGIPPSLGLWSEVLIVIGAVQKAFEAGNIVFISMIISLLVAIGLSTIYSFVTIRRIFFGSLPENLHVEEASRELIVSVAVIAAVGILFFLYPSILIDPLMKLLSGV